MNATATKIRASQLRPSKGRWRGLYGFIVIGLTVFLVTLAVWRPPADRCIAETLLEIGPISPQNSSQDLVVALGTSDASADFDRTLQAILQELQQPEYLQAAFEAAVDPTTSSDTEDDRRQVDSAALRVETRRDGDRDIRWVRIRYSGKSGSEAVEVVRHVANELQSRLKSAANEKTTSFVATEGSSEKVSSDEQVSLLIRERDAAKAEVELHVAQELERLRRLWETEQESQRVSAESKPPVVVAAPQQLPVAVAPQTDHTDDDLVGPSELRDTANPDYMRLEESLKARQRERTELLERQTKAHPQVQMLDAKIEELKEQLAQTSPTVDLSSDNDMTQGDVDARQSDKSLGVEATAESAVMIDNTFATTNVGSPVIGGNDSLDRTAPAFDESEARTEIEQSFRHQEMLAKLREMDLAVQEARAATLATPRTAEIESPDVRAVRDATLLAGIRAPLNRHQLSATGLCATSIAFVFVLLPGRRQPLTVFTDPRAVASRLGLNLVGRLPTQDGPPLPTVPPRQMSPITQRCVHAGEWVIVAIMLTVITMSIVDSHIGSQLLGNPLQAYLRSVDGIADLIINPRG